MPSESDLRSMLATAPLPSMSIDTASVIRRSRMRRLPRQVGVGSALTLAIAGIGVASVAGLRPTQQAMVTGAADQSDGRTLQESSAASGGISLAPAEKLNPCGGEVAQVEPNEAGLVLTPHFAASAPATGAEVVGTVTLTNTGTERVSGTTAALPAITLSQGGVTVWHSNGPMIMLAVMVDLAPGESMEYTSSFTPVLCTDEDETSESFREGLPALGAGAYDLSAAIYLTTEGGEAPLLVTGPTMAVTLE